MSLDSPQVDTTSTTTYPSSVLWTRDGSKVGNGIIYGVANSTYRPTVLLYLVETDFGNRMRLTQGELEAYYVVGPERDYAKWKADRIDIANQNHITDELAAFDKEHGLDSSPPA